MMTANIPCYDHETKGTVRFLDPKWIEVNCKNECIQSLKQNGNRTLPIPNFSKASILAEIPHLRSIHCTYVYNFNCKQIMEEKFCNTVMTKRTKRTTKSFTYIFGDIVSKK